MHLPFQLLLAGAITLIPLSALAASPKLPRGVAPEFAKYFLHTSQHFSCINHPDIHLLPSQINDDYCDCPDGSDEPGTSACSHLSPSNIPITPLPPSADASDRRNVFPGFWCANKGHKGAYIPFSHVNDGLCDSTRCCDGSEEWAGVQGVKCADKCKEAAKKEAKRAKEIKEVRSKGMARRRELLRDATRMRREVEERIDVLRVEIEGEEIRKRGLEEAVEKMSNEEGGKLVSGGAEGPVGVLAGLAMGRINELREALGRVRAQRDGKQGRLAELETILTKFRKEYNPNFNDEGTKRAVRAWEDYLAKNPAGDPSSASAEEADLDTILKEDSESHGVNFAAFRNETRSVPADATAALLDYRSYIPPSLLSYIDAQLASLRSYLVSNGFLAPLPDPADPTIGNPHDSQKLKELRNTLAAATKSVDEMKGWKRDKEVDLEKDYGPDGLFRAIKGKCTVTKSGEYEYELCWMEVCRQKGGHAGQTTLGNFAAFELVGENSGGAGGKEKVLFDYEEDEDSGVKLRMKYENGQQCWNGPQRRTTVDLFCGEEDQIRKVVEEEKCVYRMEVLTPAVCEASGKEGHDEL